MLEEKGGFAVTRKDKGAPSCQNGACQRMLSKTLQSFTKESSPVLRSFGKLTQDTSHHYKLFEVFRFNPNKDIKPHMERYAIDLSQ